jgi:hypothetical protein
MSKTQRAFTMFENMLNARKIILEYYAIRRRMIAITGEIRTLYADDTKPTTDYGTQEPVYTSNHVHDYFEYDKAARNTDEGGLDFDEYCCDVLGMDEPCPTCGKVIALIRERRKLKRELGTVKGKIMRLGKAIADTGRKDHE